MLCPNCNSELMNVNGRNICVECGTEVPDDQIVDPEGTFESFESTPLDQGESTTTTELLEESVDSVEAVLPTPETPEAFTAPISETAPVVESAEPLISEIPQASEVAIETPGDCPVPAETSDQTIDQLVSVPTESMEPETPILEDNQNLQEPVSVGEVTDQPEVFTLPVDVVDNSNLEPTASVAGSISDEVEPFQANIPTQPVQPIQDIMPPVIEEETVQPAPEVQATEVFTESALVQETPPIADETMQTPIDPFEVADSQANNYQVDQNMIQDGYNGLPTEPMQNVQTTAVIPEDNKKVLFALIAGVVVLLLFLIGGIVAYNLLTKPVEAPVIVSVEDSWKDYVGQDYQAKFPLTPEKSKEVLSVNEKNIELQKIFVKSEGATYAISSGKLAAGVTPSVELTEFIAALAKANNAKVDRTEVVEFDGEQATDFELSSEESTIKGRVIIRSGKVYFIQYFSIDDTSDNYDIFTNSFSFKAENIEG